MNKEKLILVFNKQITQFIDQLRAVFPHLNNDKKVQTLFDTWDTTVALTPNLPIQLFHTYIVKPYNAQIKDKEEDFFLQLYCKYEPIDMLRYLYIGASDSNKEIMWVYVERLRVLCLNFYDEEV